MHNQTSKLFGLTAIICLSLISACSFQTYQAKPLDLTATSSEFLARDPLSDSFQAYLKQQGYEDSQLPPKTWGLGELTYSALYFHSDLDVARAVWRAAQVAEQVAGQHQNPRISSTTEHHSETADGISPWTFGLAIDIPLETAGKRQARVDQAASLTAASRIEIAETAWQVRSRLHASWIEYQAAIANIGLLERESALRSEIVDMLEARLRAGMISSLEAANARLSLQKTRQLLDAEKAHQAVLKIELAHHAGLSIERLNQLQLSVTGDVARIDATRRSFTAGTAPLSAAQEAALLNRLDIRAALARYDASEAGLRLEIARQYPDIVLSPGYSYDQGDKIWSIGFSTLLSLLNRNEAGIAAAETQRELEAARFKALQTDIIRKLESRHALYIQALNNADSAAHIVDTQTGRMQSSTLQFEQGLLDRLELTSIKLESLLAQQNAVQAEFKIQRAAHALEEIMQSPLENLAPMPKVIEQDATVQPPLQRDQP